MRKFITFITVAMLATSCCGCMEEVIEDQDTFQFISETKYKTRDEKRIYNLYPSVLKYQYEGHYYLLTKFSDSFNGTEHDPKCLTCKQEWSEEIQMVYELVLNSVLEELKSNRTEEKKDIQELKKIIVRNTTSILNKIKENDIEYD